MNTWKWTFAECSMVPGVWVLRDVPEGTTFLTAQMQEGTVAVWGVVDETAPRQVRYARLAMTGEALEGPVGTYLGTVQKHGLVGHVFILPVGVDLGAL